MKPAIAREWRYIQGSFYSHDLNQRVAKSAGGSKWALWEKTDSGGWSQVGNFETWDEAMSAAEGV